MTALRGLLTDWQAHRHTPPPPAFALGPGFDGPVEFEPGTLGVLLGGPGSGKTALALQWVLAAVEADPALTAAYVCVEITAPRMVNRLLSHAGQLDYRRVRKRLLTADDEPKVAAAVARLGAVADRFHLLTDGPFVLDVIVGRLNAIDPPPGLFVLDYLQRFQKTAEKDRRSDPRERVSDLMSECRHLASQGAGVLVLSAANRAGQSGYNRLTLTSGRESGEVEYAADSVWAIQTETDGPADPVRTLETLKARDGELTETPMAFDGRHQTFRVEEPPSPDPATVPEWVQQVERRGAKG